MLKKINITLIVILIYLIICIGEPIPAVIIYTLGIIQAGKLLYKLLIKMEELIIWAIKQSRTRK